jgi:phage tail sheath gpL-like
VSPALAAAIAELTSARETLAAVIVAAPAWPTTKNITTASVVVSAKLRGRNANFIGFSVMPMPIFINIMAI